MPTVSIPTISSQQCVISSSGGPDHINHAQALIHGSTPSVHSESAAPAIPNQINAMCEGTSTQRNIIGEGESNSNPGQRTLVFLSPSGLEPSNYCSSTISESFKSQLDPKGVSWKNVLEELKEFYFEEFEKAYYWDPSINSEVKIQWRRKAARRNHCGGENVVAKGTHTGGSTTIGEHRKRLAIEKGRDPTTTVIHLHVHRHGHDGKSFVGERARIVHEKYQEILNNQIETQSSVDQFQAFYQSFWRRKKKKNIWSWISSKIILWSESSCLF